MVSEESVVGGYFLSNIKFALSIISKKWTIDIIMVLCGDSLRFSEIQKYLKQISPKILNERLSELQQFNLIQKNIEQMTPLNIQYTLSPEGLNILRALSSFSKIGLELKSEKGSGI